MNMKKMLVPVCLFMLVAGSAHAQTDPMGGIGFRSSSLGTGPLGVTLTPTLGIRQWFTGQIGGDIGVGFLSVSDELDGTTTDETTGFAFDVGLPISLRSWDRVNFIIRPGFAYGTTTAEDQSLTPPFEVKATVYSVSGELEVEWMLADRVSISAATGIAYNSLKLEITDTPPVTFERKGFGTIGTNFTQLGFHVYLW